MNEQAQTREPSIFERSRDVSEVISGLAGRFFDPAFILVLRRTETISTDITFILRGSINLPDETRLVPEEIFRRQGTTTAPFGIVTCLEKILGERCNSDEYPTVSIAKLAIGMSLCRFIYELLDTPDLAELLGFEGLNEMFSSNEESRQGVASSANHMVEKLISIHQRNGTEDFGDLSDLQAGITFVIDYWASNAEFPTSDSSV